MGKVLRRVAEALPGVALAVFLFLASVAPADAKSNLAKWAKLLHVDDWPPWLTDKRAMVVATLVVGLFYLWLYRRKQRAGEPPSPGLFSRGTTSARTPDSVVYDALARYRDGFTASWHRGASVKQWAELARWRYECAQMFTTLEHTLRPRLALHEWQRIEETYNVGDSWNDKRGALSALDENRAALLATRDVLASLAEKYAP
jgi:hypothetical protein